MSPVEISSLEYLHQTLAPVGTPRILVVEDDPDDLFFHLRVLEKFQCEVITAKSAEEAINLIREDGIDLILLDTNLPKAPPEEVISVASGLMPGASVIMVSGYPDSFTKSAAIKKGVKLILPKPLTEETLSAILQRKTGNHNDVIH